MYQLLKIVDSDISVCYEYGHHKELNLHAGSWISIYKRDAYVSLSHACLGIIVERVSDMQAAVGKSLSELGSRFSLDFCDGMVLVDPIADANGVFHGELSVRNAGNALKRKRSGCLAPESPDRHRISLTSAELARLVPIEALMRAFDEANSLGLVYISGDDKDDEAERQQCRDLRKQVLSPTKEFCFAVVPNVCEFTPISELELRPVCPLTCGEDGSECKNEPRLRLSRDEAARLLEFDEAQVLGVSVLPRAGYVYRIDAKRCVGVWQHQRYFPDAADEPAGLVCLEAPEWRLFCACLRLYIALGNYLHRRGLAPTINELHVTSLITRTHHHLWRTFCEPSVTFNTVTFLMR